jgi:RNase H-fold protein (predicted Holliday junction resolvase)
MQEAGHRKIKGNNRRELKDQISAALILSSYVETMRNLNNKIL